MGGAGRWCVAGKHDPLEIRGSGRENEMKPETWHYGLVAKWWSEFNDDFRPHEIPYFQAFIERDVQSRTKVGE